MLRVTMARPSHHCAPPILRRRPLPHGQALSANSSGRVAADAADGPAGPAAGDDAAPVAAADAATTATATAAGAGPAGTASPARGTAGGWAGRFAGRSLLASFRASPPTAPASDGSADATAANTTANANANATATANANATATVAVAVHATAATVADAGGGDDVMDVPCLVDEWERNDNCNYVTAVTPGGGGGVAATAPAEAPPDGAAGETGDAVGGARCHRTARRSRGTRSRAAPPATGRGQRVRRGWREREGNGRCAGRGCGRGWATQARAAWEWAVWAALAWTAWSQGQAEAAGRRPAWRWAGRHRRGIQGHKVCPPPPTTMLNVFAHASSAPAKASVVSTGMGWCQRQWK